MLCQRCDENVIGWGSGEVWEIGLPGFRAPVGPGTENGPAQGGLDIRIRAQDSGYIGIQLLAQALFRVFGVAGNGNGQLPVAALVDGNAQPAEHLPCLLLGRDVVHTDSSFHLVSIIRIPYLSLERQRKKNELFRRVSLLLVLACSSEMVYHKRKMEESLWIPWKP